MLRSYVCALCNTAHFAIDEIEASVNIPFIDMIEVVALEIKKGGKKKVGIMASDRYVKFKIYDKYIKKCVLR